MTQTHDDLTLGAVKFLRNEGANLADIHQVVQARGAESATRENVRQALERLEREGRVTHVGKKWFPTPPETKHAGEAASEPEFQREDEWILLALMYDMEHGPTSLDRIIAIADAINKSLPTVEELHGALNRLAAAGLIRERRGSFELRPKGVDLYSKLNACTRRSDDEFEALGRLLRCPCCGPRLGPIRWAIPLSEKDYNAAVAKYYRG